MQKHKGAEGAGPGKTAEAIGCRVYFVIVSDFIERVGPHLEASFMTAVEGSMQRTVRLFIYLLIPQAFIVYDLLGTGLTIRDAKNNECPLTIGRRLSREKDTGGLNPPEQGSVRSAGLVICRGSHRSLWVSTGGPMRASHREQTFFFFLHF